MDEKHMTGSEVTADSQVSSAQWRGEEKFHLAFHTITWGRRIDDLDRVLEVIAACGYEGVEFAQSPDEIHVRDEQADGGRRPVRGVQELLAMLQRHGLQLAGLAGGTLPTRVKFCGDYRPPYLHIEDLNWPAFSALRLEKPFVLALHPHWFMRVKTTRQAEQRLQRYRKWVQRRCERTRGGKKPGDLRLLPDTAHLTIAEEDCSKVLEDFQSSLAAVHLKDWTPAYGRYSHRYTHGFVPLGKGVVALEKVLQTLVKIAFEGWVVVELDCAEKGPLDSALACSEWLSHKTRLRVDYAKIESLRKREVQAQKAFTHPDSRTIFGVNFLSELLPETVREPALFYQKAVDVLYSWGGLDAVALYSYYPRNEELYLLAVAGGPPSLKTVCSVPRSLSAQVARDKQWQEFDLNRIGKLDRFEEAGMLQAAKGGYMITVPVFNSANTQLLRYLLNLFPSDKQHYDIWKQRKEEFSRLGMQLSQLADMLVNENCSAAATRTSLACAGLTSRAEFLPRLRDLVHNVFDCDAVSIFLVDETGRRLEVDEQLGTTGIEWDPEFPPQERFYRKGEGITGAVWESRELRLVADTTRVRKGRTKWRSRELRKPDENARDECMFASMVRIGGPVLGVIRLRNKKPLPNSRAGTMFTDEDAAVLDAIVQAALPHLELLTLQERQKEAVLRMTHEFRGPLVAIRGAVDHLQHSLKVRKISAASEFGKDYPKDILDWTQLMGRLTTNARLFASQPGQIKIQASKTLLLRDVVAPAVNQVGLLLQEKRFPRVDIAYGDFSEIPYLWIDRNQFQQVFFNLLSNSIKYAEGKVLRVRIEGGLHGNLYIIWFSDWGIGVPSGLEESIFRPGFRSTEAKERDVAGQGIGLYVVQNIVQAHGGEVVLRKRYKPTQFEIQLPSSLRLQPPPRKS
ncbi:MAG: ATP-binding protein [Verrucomicrobiota bacterium]|jgi:signal transduction histidine kinase/sugar phosphate isomerase/epimerase